MSVILETVCASARDCEQAAAGGADRIELCAAMVVGGLTPSLGTLIEARRRTGLPIMCMVRPRPGAFGYDDAEVDTMCRDAELFAANGASGIVFGFLTADCAVDVPRTRRLVEAAGPVETVFHRAFDLVAEPFAALDALIEAGVRRVLTGGRERSAIEGAELIRALVERAVGRIEILPGGGVRASNVADLVRRTGVTAVHCGPFTTGSDPTARANPGLSFAEPGAPPDTYPVVDVAAIRAVRQALASL